MKTHDCDVWCQQYVIWKQNYTIRYELYDIWKQNQKIGIEKTVLLEITSHNVPRKM